jgi:hypothetical protein
MRIRDTCPACGCSRYKKHGHTRPGKQQQCQACARQCGATAEDHRMADERRIMVGQVLRERIVLRGICRAVSISLTWLWHCMVLYFAACPDDVHVQLPQRANWTERTSMTTPAQPPHTPSRPQPTLRNMLILLACVGMWGHATHLQSDGTGVNPGGRCAASPRAGGTHKSWKPGDFVWVM